MGFHMGGKKTHDTLLGALVSIGIITTISLYIIKLSIQRKDLLDSPVLVHSVDSNFYKLNDTISRFENNFDFAIAVANINLENASWEETFNNVQVKAYLRSRNYYDMKMHHDDIEIKMVPCTDFEL